jgi:hypothetical protein
MTVHQLTANTNVMGGPSGTPPIGMTRGAV